jgi:hypothetical protein
MDFDRIIQRLQSNKDVFAGLLRDRTEKEYLFKPSPDQWCMLEVICHLVDEEKEDFRTRVDLVLANPKQELPKFNPINWVTERDYLGQNFNEKLEEFITERQASIDWLMSLQKPDWTNTYNHPALGPMSAGLFLSNWLAHDYIHIRQINRLSYAYLQSLSEIDLAYAGNFKA